MGHLDFLLTHPLLAQNIGSRGDDSTVVTVLVVLLFLLMVVNLVVSITSSKKRPSALDLQAFATKVELRQTEQRIEGDITEVKSQLRDVKGDFVAGLGKFDTTHNAVLSELQTIASRLGRLEGESQAKRSTGATVPK